jgi:hypothetical protein
MDHEKYLMINSVEDPEFIDLAVRKEPYKISSRDVADFLTSEMILRSADKYTVEASRVCLLRAASKEFYLHKLVYSQSKYKDNEADRAVEGCPDVYVLHVHKGRLDVCKLQGKYQHHT